MKSAIKVGRGLLRKPAWARLLGRRVCLVTEPEAHRRFGRKLLDALRREGIEAALHLLPAGEAAKTLACVHSIYRTLVRSGLGRDGGVIALGGGAVTDAAGFAAATYLRGVPWITVPTTLLGQVDSGIGGKTGVNIAEGKNLVGAFHQPRAVICDLAVLDSLPLREVISGLGEAVKYGLVFDRAFFDRMRRDWDRLLALDPLALAPVVRRCAALKAEIVAKDERETTGLRELLNFGHTVGHALETEAGYGTLRHGEAVVWGMRAALALSLMKTGLPKADALDAGRVLAQIPVPRPPARPERLLARMRRDKKARGGRIRFVLLKRIGRPVVAAVTESEARAALEVLR
ncbi:MAG: 3-dehydroquinate synthase [Elusimicrobia bacterium]|nr:3-dehydroquinate synthase [Elusimicrobiota bacterium]